MGNVRKDLTGQRFGHWLVLERAENKNGKIMYLCECDCGTRKIIAYQNLTEGFSRSCGCSKGSKSTPKNPSRYRSRLYMSWTGMKERCLNPKASNYKYYGGKGIKIYDEWLDFKNFSEWALNNGYNEGLTIDRIDNSKDYTPSNCRWVTWREQFNNKTSCHYITHKGETHSLKDWSRITGISYSAIRNRARKSNDSNYILRPVEG